MNTKSYLLLLLLTGISVLPAVAQKQLRVVLAGLSHDHVHEALQRFKKGEVVITGIAEPDEELVKRYQKQYQLPASLFYKNLDELLKKQKPDAVLAYNAIAEHLAVVETCAPKGIHVMVEKPLATTVKDAKQMVMLASKYNIHLLTNYETTWYTSNQHVYKLVNEQGAIGDIRKMVVHDGHQGPKEIGVSKEFLKWLTDPVKNGGGAIIDFGCYGANLMTWLMKGQAPIAVTAVTRQVKPDVYPKVDDDATIILEYPNTTGIIEASWNWPFSIKDLEVFGKTGYLQAVNKNTIRSREKENLPYKIIEADTASITYRDNLSYLADVIQGKTDPAKDLSSLDNNLVVVKILEAARQSAKTGKRVVVTD